MKFKPVLILATVFLLFVTNVNAGRITTIQEGDEAEYSGFLIDHDQERKFRTINEEHKLLQKKVVTLEDLALIQKERANYYKDMHAEAVVALKRKDSRTFWGKTVYFIGGIVVTGAISYAAIKYAR